MARSTTTITTRIPPHARRLAEIAAAERGLSLSAWAGRVLREAALLAPVAEPHAAAAGAFAPDEEE